jgi:phosphotransferase system enzyme I (PtsI)
MCLKDLAMFRPQLRAILRASAHGSGADDDPDAVHHPGSVSGAAAGGGDQAGTAESGLAFDEKMPVGGMIEIPAAAVCASISSPAIWIFCRLAPMT